MKTVVIRNVVPAIGETDLNILRLAFLIGDTNGARKRITNKVDQILKRLVVSLK